MFWGAFLAPILGILVLNVLLYAMIVVIVIKHTRSSMARRQEAINIKTVVRLLISTMGIMALFGLSWLFAALTFTSQRAVQYPAQILFTLSTSFQGVFIFFFLCILAKDIRETWKEFLSFGHYRSSFLRPDLKSMTGIPHQQREVSTLTSTKVLTQRFGGGTRSASSNLNPNFRDLSPGGKDSSYPEKIDSPIKVDSTTESSGANGGTQLNDSTTDRSGTGNTSGVMQVEQVEERGNTSDDLVQKSMKIRIKRHSTMVAHKHDIEEFQVDFNDLESDSSSSEKELEDQM